MDATSHGGEQLGFEEGQIIANRYQVIDCLGSGGMGMVLRVLDLDLDNEPTALKLLYPHLVEDPTIFARFRNEVLVSRNLAHPNITRIYDFGQAGSGYYFISMEYVAGSNLGSRIYARQLGPIPFEDILKLLYQISTAIGYAHSKGVIHRDLKPDNVLLTESREVRVTDFGLARSLFIDKKFTATGEAVGTPYYMAPEQIRGQKLDHRCDIYSLGIMAYEMVVGRRPFIEDNWLQLAQKHFSEPVPSFANPEEGIPTWFEDLVQTCTAKDREDRFATMEEVSGVIVENMEDETRERCHLPTFYFKGNRKRVKTKWRNHSQRQVIIKSAVWLGLITFIVSVSLALAHYNSFVHSSAASSILSLEKKGVSVGFLKFLVGSKLEATPLALETAIKNGDTASASILLSAGISPQGIIDANGNNLLHQAATAGNIELVKQLLRAGILINSKNLQSETPLMLAIVNSKSELASELVKLGASVNDQDYNNNTAIILSAQKGDLTTTQILIDHNALVDVRNSKNETPLILAVKGGFLSIIDLLLSKNASSANLDNEGNSALSLAVIGGEKNISIIRSLMNAGANPEVKNQKGQTALDLARSSQIITQILQSGRELRNPVSFNEHAEEPEAAVSIKENTTKKTSLMIVGGVNVDVKTITPRKFDMITGIKVTVKNKGEVTAENVEVFAEIPGQASIQLTPELNVNVITRNSTAIFSVSGLSNVIAYNTKPRIKLSCSNCWK